MWTSIQISISSNISTNTPGYNDSHNDCSRVSKVRIRKRAGAATPTQCGRPSAMKQPNDRALDLSGAPENCIDPETTDVAAGVAGC
jgi:hypothetical protein